MKSLDSPVTAEEALHYGYETLKCARIETYRLDAQLLLAHSLRKDRAWLICHICDEISPEAFIAYKSHIVNRAEGMPYQYIVGNCEFYSLDFYVDSNVLIPRPETELLTELIIKRIGAEHTRVVEIGTGSGCIAVCAAYHCPSADITALDTDARALAVARINALKHGVAGRVRFLENDVFSGLPAGLTADIIVSNPPYIPSGEINMLSRSVRDYEPPLALDGGEDGLKFYRCIAAEARAALTDGGMIFFEIGYNQGIEVKNILLEYGYGNIVIIKDLSGCDRIVFAEMRLTQNV